MATAQREGGLYYTDKGQAVDAQGNAVEGAPKRAPDTDPSKQPGAPDTDPSKQPGAAGGGPAPGTMTMRLDDDSLRALGGKVPAAPKGQGGSGEKAAAKTAEEDGGDEEELPTIKDLPAAVAKLKTVAEVKAMAKRDDRATAEKIYDDRIAELEEK